MLNYRHVPATCPTADTTMVFLHGLAGSQASWLPPFESLSEHGHLLFTDCLGFGQSPRPPGAYSVSDHIQALQLTLRDWLDSQAGLPDQRIVLVGHSMGALLCAKWSLAMLGALATKDLQTKRTPRFRLIGTVLASMPLFTDEQDAIESIARTSLFNRWMALETPLARATCWLMCHVRPLLTPLMPRLLPDLPPAVARDSLQHSWASYSRTLQQVIIRSHGPQLMEQLAHTQLPTLVIHGKQDAVADPSRMQQLLECLPADQHAAITALMLDGTHDIVFTHAPEMAAAIAGWLDKRSN